MLVIEHFERGVERFRNRAAVIEGEGSLTYAEMEDRMLRIARGLLRSGLPVDSSVALLSPNHSMVLACQYGIFKAGMLWVPINYRNSVSDNLAQLAKYDTRLLFFHSSLLEHAVAARSALPDLRHCICIDAKVDGFASLADWFSEAEGEAVTFPIRQMEDAVAISSTGGTTGDPKGAIHTNRSFEAVVASVYALFQFDEPPVHLIVAPLTHAAAIFHYALLPRGGTQILLSSTDPVAVLEAIERHRVSVVYLPPTLI